jgi:hypothetical protein
MQKRSLAAADISISLPGARRRWQNGRRLEVYRERSIPMTRPKTKILVDGGDPQETRRVKELLGFVDGQTTNPSLIAKNPHIRELIASGHKLSNREEMDEYKQIVQTISPLVGDAGVSIEVFSMRGQWHKRCSTKAGKCFRGFPTLTSSIHARQKASVRHRCQSGKACE